jgi:hypothetical protein
VLFDALKWAVFAAYESDLSPAAGRKMYDAWFPGKTTDAGWGLRQLINDTIRAAKESYADNNQSRDDFVSGADDGKHPSVCVREHDSSRAERRTDTVRGGAQYRLWDD